MSEPLKPPQYAVVAYVRNPVGQFVEDLRRELFPEHGHLPAHVTVLPPRPIEGTEEDAIRSLQEHSARFKSFEVRMGNVESFSPTTPTVFLRVEHSAHRFRDLHEELNTRPLYCNEHWPYMPHLTIVKMPELDRAEQALAKSRERWANYSGSKSVQIEELTFVREGGDNRWVDLATIPLGKLDSTDPRTTPKQSTPAR